MGKLLKAPQVIELRSDLGGGKTTFVRGIVNGLGSKDKVVSPSFTLNRIYKAPNLEIHHFDFYRLAEPGIVSDQLKESLANPKVITVVEWSDIVKNVLPANRLTIEFTPIPDNPDSRNIKFIYTPKHATIIKKLQTVMSESES